MQSGSLRLLEKQGIGTAQSHTRYEILTQTLEERGAMTETEARDALDSVSKEEEK